MLSNGLTVAKPRTESASLTMIHHSLRLLPLLIGSSFHLTVKCVLGSFQAIAPRFRDIAPPQHLFQEVSTF